MRPRSPLAQPQETPNRADTVVMQTFQAWLRSEGYAPRTVTLYTQIVRRADRYLAGIGVALDTATIGDLRSFWLSVPEHRESRKGARCALIAWYRYRGIPGGGLARDLPNLPAPHRLPRPHSAEEYVRFIDAARELGGRHQVVGDLLAHTGARISEVRCATWAQFDLAAAEPVWYITGKGSARRGARIRQVPVHPRLASTLRGWMPSPGATGPLFPSERSDDGFLSYSTMRETVAEIAKAAQVDRSTAHRWRHTVATLGLERDGNLRDVQDLLGHASLTSTQIYTAVAPSRLTRLVGTLG